MPNIGPIELIIILVIALIVLGPKRLPEVGKSIGESIREFRKATTDVQDSMSLESKQATQGAGTTAAAVATPAAAPAPVAPAPVSDPAAPAPEPAPVAPAEEAPAAASSDTANG
jgi:sec-independent protein translocase protein TatA